LIVAVAAISFAAIFFRGAAPTSPLATAGWRLAFAAILLTPWIYRVHRAGRLPSRVWGWGVVAGLAYAVHFGAWVASLELTRVAASVTLVTASPLLLAIVGALSGRDRPSRRLWLALGVAAAGMLIVGWRDLFPTDHLTPDALLGDALALLGAVAIAGYLLVVRRLGDQLDALAFTGIAAGVGAVTLLATALVTGTGALPATWEATGFIALAALIPQLIGHTTLTWALRHVSPTMVGIATLGEPVGATALAWWLLDESVDAVTIVGCAVVLAGVALAVALPSADASA
jgi:drug/metabolite transporter (DMT)-like permease